MTVLLILNLTHLSCLRRYTSVPKKPEEEEVAVRAKGFDQELSTRDKRKQSRELQAGAGASVTPPGSARAMPGLSATLKVGTGAQAKATHDRIGSLVKITQRIGISMSI